MPLFDWPPPWGHILYDKPGVGPETVCDYLMGGRMVRVADWRGSVWETAFGPISILIMDPATRNHKHHAKCDDLLSVYAVLCELEKASAIV